MIFYDTETCGFHGMCVLIQWAEDDGRVHLHSVWTEPISKTLDLIQWMMGHELCGFNLAYDQFHLCKIYTILSLVKDKNLCPEDIINEIAYLEPEGRDGLCLKPKAACDLMLHARKGPYQSTMDRRNISIRKIPALVCFEVRDILEQAVKLEDIYFARRKDKLAPKWQIVDRDDCDDFKDIVLKFRASSALKILALHALELEEDSLTLFGEIGLPKSAFPIEVGYAPFALALSNETKNWYGKVKKGSGYWRGYAWPGVIRRHIAHWLHNKPARKYAVNDVVYVRDLWRSDVFGKPEPGDDDSELACMVGAVRWKGYKVDLDKIKELRFNVVEKIKKAPISPSGTKQYLLEVMDETEGMVIEKSTKKIILEEVITWDNDDGTKHEAAIRAQQVLDARQAKSDRDLYDKMLLAGRFHASFKVIGALSSRMSGGDDLNAQGIRRDDYVREAFPLADSKMTLCGGDFKAFEVGIAIAYYGDEKLEAEVKSGKSAHGLFGTHVYPTMSYDEIVANKKKYTRSKSGLLALIYFGNEHTLMTRLGVKLEAAQAAYQSFIKKYKGIGEGRKAIINDFCSMKQPGGIGTRVEWHNPPEYMESMFGFRRYFTLENTIGKILFKLANNPPQVWKGLKQKVVRRDREQTVSGAIQSAIYAAAFAIQASVMRAAGNHVIQSTGATITKHVQREIWDIQPSGITTWYVMPMNIHDEIMCPTEFNSVEKVTNVVEGAVNKYKEIIPLIDISWGTDLVSWADK